MSFWSGTVFTKEEQEIIEEAESRRGCKDRQKPRKRWDSNTGDWIYISDEELRDKIKAYYTSERLAFFNAIMGDNRKHWND